MDQNGRTYAIRPEAKGDASRRLIRTCRAFCPAVCHRAWWSAPDQVGSRLEGHLPAELPNKIDSRNLCRSWPFHVFWPFLLGFMTCRMPRGSARPCAPTKPRFFERHDLRRQMPREPSAALATRARAGELSTLQPAGIMHYELVRIVHPAED